MWFMVGFLTNDVLQRIESSKTDDIVWHVVMLGLCVLFVAVDALWPNDSNERRRYRCTLHWPCWAIPSGPERKT